NVSHVKDVDNVVIMRHGAITSHAKYTDISEKEILAATEEDENEKKEEVEDEDDTNEESKLITETTKERKVYQEFRKKGEVDLDVYKKYMQFGGGIFALLSILSLYAIAQFVQSYGDKLVSQW